VALVEPAELGDALVQRRLGDQRGVELGAGERRERGVDRGELGERGVSVSPTVRSGASRGSCATYSTDRPRRRVIRPDSGPVSRSPVGPTTASSTEPAR
jgi:hypothetical protein